MFLFIRTHIDHIYVGKALDDEKTVIEKFNTLNEARRFAVDKYGILFNEDGIMKQYEEFYEELKIYEIIEI